MTDTTRDEHLQWCKDRALEYVDQGEVKEAFASMGSDLNKHSDTRGHPAIGLGIMQLASGLLNSRAEMRKFIQGFH